MSDPNDPVQHRDSMLPMMLGLSVVGFLCLVLILLTGGFFFYVGLVVLGMIAVGLFHYLLWGRAMTEQTAGEREELDRRDRAREQAKKGAGPMFRR